MFCDLVGSTALSTQLDPEEVSDLTREYQRVCAEVVERHEGRIARFIGDGILVYFGYPLSHEDDAQRAVRSALDIVAAISVLRGSLERPVHVRVAVHTGLVVVGQLGGDANPDPMAISGETPNVAARLQELASPDTVVTSAATYRLIEGFFLCRSLGTPALRGVASPIEVYEVLEPTGIVTRFEQAVASGLTPFVGREDEVSLLVERWEQIKARHGEVVMLRGEAGIGKSRLVRALVDRTTGEPLWELSCRCSPYYQNSALYPVIECLQGVLRYHRNDDADTKLAKLEQALDQFGFDLTSVVPLFASLLSLPSGRYPFASMAPPRQKQKTLEAIVELLMRAAERGATRLIVEDLHWADASTLELIDLLVARVSRTRLRLLLILVFRPDFVPPWSLRAHITDMTLGRFSRPASERIIQLVAGGKPLPAEIVKEITEKTEGVPLFVEELTRMVLESPLLQEHDGRYLVTDALPSLAIPTTLHDSLMARLDRLGAAKDVAQLGATIGREFSYELLRAVYALDETILTGALNRLVDAELLHQGLENGLTYTFSHALVRDAAYNSLLRSQRRRYHRKVAEVLQERFAETVETRPELLAHHFTEAGLVEEAIPYWQRAGQHALERSANKEAISHLNKGIELLGLLPENAEHVQQEVLLRVALGTAAMIAKGFASVEAERAWSRARKLCDQLGESPLVFQVLWGLWVFHEARGEHHQAREAGEECFRLAQSAQSPALLVEAHHAVGACLACLGEFAEALLHLEQGAAIYDPQEHAAQAYVYGQDAGVACLCHGAWALWLLGYPDRARQRIGEGLALARRLSHPVSKAAAANLAWWVYQLLGDAQAAREQADAAVALSSEQESEFWKASGIIGQGWALTELGQVEEGIARLRAGMSALRMTGAQILLPYWTALLAQAQGRARRVEEGLSLLAEAENIVAETGERWCLAALYRMRGELLLRRPEPSDRNEEEAEDYFRQALVIAQEQRAKSLELWGAVSLSRLWKKQGKQAAARQMLSDLYNGFTEGFDTPDLREARALIELM